MIGTLESINHVTHKFIPLFVLINFLLFLILIYLNWRYIKKFLLEIDKKTWILLAIIFIFVLSIRIFIPAHHHLMYIDEAWYMEAGKEMLQTGSQGDYLKSIGWPFILAIAFGIFGISNWVAIYTSLVLGSLTIFTMFFLTFIITKNKSISLISPLILLLFPAHIRWSTTAETNVVSIFFITLTLFFCFLYYKKKKTSLLWLSLIGLAFIAQFRPENHIFLLLFLIGCVLFNKNFFKRVNLQFILPWLVCFILIIPNLIQVVDLQSSTEWMKSDTSGEISGSNFGIYNLFYNSLNFGPYLFNNKFQPLLFSLLLIMGAVYMVYKKRRESLFLISWFLLLWFVYFFSWFQTLGGGTDLPTKTRLFMSFYPITVIFVCYGILLIERLLGTRINKNILKKVIFPVVSLIFILLFIPYTTEYLKMYSTDTHLLETKIPELAEKDIPPGCVIVANWPTILKSTTDLNVIDIHLFLGYPQYQEEIFNQNNCVLFFEDFTCSLRESDREQCEKIKESFLMEEFIFYEENDVNYTFYKINQ